MSLPRIDYVDLVKYDELTRAVNELGSHISSFVEDAIIAILLYEREIVKSNTFGDISKIYDDYEHFGIGVAHYVVDDVEFFFEEYKYIVGTLTFGYQDGDPAFTISRKIPLYLAETPQIDHERVKQYVSGCYGQRKAQYNRSEEAKAIEREKVANLLEATQRKKDFDEYKRLKEMFGE